MNLRPVQLIIFQGAIMETKNDHSPIKSLQATNLLEQLIEDKSILTGSLLQSLMEGVMITDTSGVIKYMNPAFSEITGYGAEAIGLNPRILKSGKHDLDFYKQIWESIKQVGQWKGEIWNVRKNGQLYVQWTTITVIRDDCGKALYYTAVFSDITERIHEEQKLHDDLLLAREVQKGLLTQPVKEENIHIEGVYLPSIMLGGDMYAWYKIDEHRYGIFLMDVMGHGVASALVCMSLHSLLKGIINRLIVPEQVMQELNHHVISLYRENDSLSRKNYYLTGIYVVVDTKRKKITYASAGHPPGFFIDDKGIVTELDSGCIPLGILSEIEVETGVLTYTNKSKIILYTDGLIEKAGYSTRKSIDSLKELILSNQEDEVDQMLKQILSSLSEINGSEKFQDDVSLVITTFT